MIDIEVYVIQERSRFEAGQPVEKYYTVAYYKKMTPNGILTHGATVKEAETERDAEVFCRKKGLIFQCTRQPDRAQIWIPQDAPKIKVFGDCHLAVIPECPVDTSEETFFDETEYACWELIQRYANHLGVQLISSGDVSWDRAKELQDFILDMFTDTGVNIDNGNIALSTEERDYLAKCVLSAAQDGYCHHSFDNVEVDRLENSVLVKLGCSPQFIDQVSKKQ